MSRSLEMKQRILAQHKSQKVFLRLFEQLWQMQTMAGGRIHGENPQGSVAWKELTLGSPMKAISAIGLKHPESSEPILKPTRVVTSDAALAACRCPGHSHHVHFEGSYK